MGQLDGSTGDGGRSEGRQGSRGQLRGHTTDMDSGNQFIGKHQNYASAMNSASKIAESIAERRKQLDGPPATGPAL